MPAQFVQTSKTSIFAIRGISDVTNAHGGGSEKSRMFYEKLCNIHQCVARITHHYAILLANLTADNIMLKPMSRSAEKQV